MNFDAVSKNAKILKIGPVEPKLQKIRQTVIGNSPRYGIVQYRISLISGFTLFLSNHHGKIRRDTVLYNTAYLCNKMGKIVEEVDNTSSTFISVFFTNIQE